MAKSGRRHILFVTGISGAGKSTTLNVLEDLGYEAVDNLPVSLLTRLVLSDVSGPVAIGIDVRTRDFDAGNILDVVHRLKSVPDLDITILFLECDDAELENRFKTTRRRHPLARDRRVRDGIAQERPLLAPLKENADLIIDSTGQNVVDFRRTLEEHFGSGDIEGMTIFVTSFSFAKGVPREADMVMDVRFLDNPHYTEDLRAATGLDPAVGDFIKTDPGYSDFMRNFRQLLSPLLPGYAREGKRYLTIAVGCTGGRHRSVFVSERITEWLLAEGWNAQIHHRDLGNDKNLENDEK